MATLNEPVCTAFLGYKDGMFAPGRNSLADALAASHTLLLAHGKAVQAFRASAAHGRVGIAVNLCDIKPATRSAADRAAAKREDAFNNLWYLNPIFGKPYPKVLVDWYAGRCAPFKMATWTLIASPIDVFGLNYYNGHKVSAHAASGFLKTRDEMLREEATELTEMGWGVWPLGLYNTLMRLKNEFGNPPVIITENGMAAADVPDDAGAVDDDRQN